MTPFDTAMAQLPLDLQDHMRSWYDATHDGGRSRTVDDLQRKVAFLAEQYARNSDAVLGAIGTDARWKAGRKVAQEVTLSGWGHEIVLHPDGTYYLNDTCGG